MILIDILIKKRMKLLTGTVPVSNSLWTGTVPVNNFLLTWNVPVNNSLLTGILDFLIIFSTWIRIVWLMLALSVFEMEPSKSHFRNPHPYSIWFQLCEVWVRNTFIKKLILQKLLLGSSPSPTLRTRSWLYSVPVRTRTRTRRTITKIYQKGVYSWYLIL